MRIQSRVRLVDLIVGCSIVMLDQVTKYVSLDYFVLGECRWIGSFGPVDLLFNLTTNQGAAWGVCGEFPRALLSFRLFFVLVLVSLYLFSKKSISIRMAIAAIIAGACSNIIDTLHRGQVIDMILLRFWGWDYPIFNLADVAICTGALYIVIHSFVSEKPVKG